MRKLFLTLIGILCFVVVIVVVRTARFASRQIQVPAASDIMLDIESLQKRLSEAIQYKTISFQEAVEPSAQEFQRFHAFLADSFPSVHKNLAQEVVGGYSLLYTWKGNDERLKPIQLMGHMDVVPVDPKSEKNWTHPPFSGHAGDGFIWGRGTMDDKVSVLGILEAVEHLLAQGFQPRRTIYLAFGHDEEIGGNNGAAKIAALLHTRGLKLEYVLDEGMNIVDGIIPGIGRPVALIGIAEKGYVSLELAVESPGGHASVPPAHTAIGTLSSAIHRLEGSPFPSRLDGPTRQMFEFLGPEMHWRKRILFANLWLFDLLARRELAQSPLTDATIRTTQAATIFQAGVRENILPTTGRAVVNYRILPGDSINGVVERVRRTIDNPAVRISPLPIRVDASPVSDTESESFKILHRTIREVTPETVVAPSLLVAATDSRHYAKLTNAVFRFLPITIGAEDARRYHGIDERISIRDYERCVRFYVQLIRNSNFGSSDSRVAHRGGASLDGLGTW